MKVSRKESRKTITRGRGETTCIRHRDTGEDAGKDEGGSEKWKAMEREVVSE